MSNTIRTSAPLRALVFLAAAVALLAVPAAAGAKSATDRDRDGMPTKWEIKNKLNPFKNDARRDSDRDRLANLAEFRTQMKPRDPDSDNDGKLDGAEGAGIIVRFAPNRMLTLKLFNGKTLRGKAMTSLTEMCGGAPRPPRPAGEGENPGDPRVEAVRALFRHEDDDFDDVEGDTDGDGVVDEDYDPTAAEVDPGEDKYEDFDNKGCGMKKLKRGAVVAESNFIPRQAGYNFWSDAEASFFNYLKFVK